MELVPGGFRFRPMSLDWFPRHVVDWRMRTWARPAVKASKRHGYGR